MEKQPTWNNISDAQKEAASALLQQTRANAERLHVRLHEIYKSDGIFALALTGVASTAFGPLCELMPLPLAEAIIRAAADFTESTGMLMLQQMENIAEVE